MPKALKTCLKYNKLPNLVTLIGGHNWYHSVSSSLGTKYHQSSYLLPVDLGVVSAKWVNWNSCKVNVTKKANSDAVVMKYVINEERR